MKEEKMKTGKPDRMTSLSGNLVVSKTQGRIVFRGVIDTLQAELIEAQVLAAESGEAEYCDKIGEMLEYLRSLMAAEVKETPLPPPFLFGLDADELRRQSHDTEKIFGMPLQLPSYTQGKLAARINTLRAKAREAELLAIKVFGPRKRDDICLALNRLSSALWWLFCKCLADKASIQ